MDTSNKDIISMIKDYFYKNNQIIFLRNAIVLSLSDSKNVKKIFSLNVNSQLSRIFNKKYRIEYIKGEYDFFGDYIMYSFVVYKNDKPIYYEKSGRIFNRTKDYLYNPENIESGKNKIEPIGGTKKKPLFFDFKNFWWRLNLEKAKLLIKEKSK